MTGEIIDAELIVTPRPSRKHVFTATVLGSEVTAPYHFGEGGGPGGWIILIDPEISLGEEIVVPELAGWKEERWKSSSAVCGWRRGGDDQNDVGFSAHCGLAGFWRNGLTRRREGAKRFSVPSGALRLCARKW
jgi:hypothetical protein